MAFFVYIIRCADGSYYYVGHAENVALRIKTHNDGGGAKYTFLRRPVTLAYSEPAESKIQAIRRERQIKGWTRAKKEALIAGDLELLKRLSRKS